MGQFDLQTDAALTVLQSNELVTTPGEEFVEVIADLIALTGAAGPLGMAAGATNLLNKIRRLAGASYASNLIYTITAVRDDLRTLYERDAAMRQRIEFLPDDPGFVEAISALALRAMHTSSKNRLKRLARIVVNGVRNDDLEPESLDDMMRAAVELKESDIALLGQLYHSQAQEMVHQSARRHPSFWKNNFESIWRQFVDDLNPKFHLQYRSSLSRMAAMGFLMRTDFSVSYGFGLEPHVLLPEGAMFYERLQEISAESVEPNNHCLD
jgi:hypothetical protein